jgi:hypothetical protein
MLSRLLPLAAAIPAKAALTPHRISPAVTNQGAMIQKLISAALPVKSICRIKIVDDFQRTDRRVLAQVNQVPASAQAPASKALPLGCD